MEKTPEMELCEICQNPTGEDPYNGFYNRFCDDCENDLFELEIERINKEIK